MIITTLKNLWQKHVTLADNPLVNSPRTPHGAPPYDKIREEHFVPAIEWAIEKARIEVDTIKFNPAMPNFENTIEALAFAGNDLGRIHSIYGVYSGVQMSDNLNKIGEEKIIPAMSAFMNDVKLDDVIFERVKAVYEAKKDDPSLTQEQKTLLEKTYKGYARSGTDLSPEKKKRIREINTRLGLLSEKYEKNTVDSANALKIFIEDEERLAGIPQRIKDGMKADAERNDKPGTWLIRVSPPPFEIYSYAENRELREQAFKQASEVANQDKQDNKPLVMEIVALRDEKAKMLGYQNHADYVLEDRMAGNTQTVMDFIEKNKATYKPACDEYVSQLLDFARETDNLDEIKPWDIIYYGRKMKEKLFQIDPEEIKQYFKLENVVDGAFRHAEKLLGIRFEEATDQYTTYEPDVKVYEVFDRETGNIQAVFYTDYFSRDNKRGGAWADSLRDAGLHNGKQEVPIIGNWCNFNKAPESQSTLLSLGDVTTVWHELGHALHAMLGEGKYPELNGFHTKWDFVELPSQINENWALEADILKEYAIHHETGKAIPDELIQKIKDSSNFDAGYIGLRQVFLGLLDMTWHTQDPQTIDGVEALEDAVTKEVGMPNRTGGPISTHFGHLFAGGYAAGYYSYKWAEVLDADGFEAFKETGDLYHEDTAKRWKSLLQGGGKTPPMDLYRAFRGREPDPDALFRREGLLAVNDNPPPETDNTIKFRPS